MKKSIIIHYESLYKNVKKNKNGLWLKIDFQSIILDSKIEKSNKPFSYWNNSHWHYYDCNEVIFYFHNTPLT